MGSVVTNVGVYILIFKYGTAKIKGKPKHFRCYTLFTLSINVNIFVANFYGKLFHILAWWRTVRTVLSGPSCRCVAFTPECQEWALPIQGQKPPAITCISCSNLTNVNHCVSSLCDTSDLSNVICEQNQISILGFCLCGSLVKIFRSVYSKYVETLGSICAGVTDVQFFFIQETPLRTRYRICTIGTAGSPTLPHWCRVMALSLDLISL